MHTIHWFVYINENNLTSALILLYWNTFKIFIVLYVTDISAKTWAISNVLRTCYEVQKYERNNILK